MAWWAARSPTTIPWHTAFSLARPGQWPYLVQVKEGEEGQAHPQVAGTVEDCQPQEPGQGHRPRQEGGSPLAQLLHLQDKISLLLIYLLAAVLAG